MLKEYANYHLQQNSLKEAEALLRRILEDDVKKTPEDGEWSHGRLALLLSSGEDYSRFKEALTHVGHKLDETGAVEKRPYPGWPSGSPPRRCCERPSSGSRSRIRARPLPPMTGLSCCACTSAVTGPRQRSNSRERWHA